MVKTALSTDPEEPEDHNATELPVSIFVSGSGGSGGYGYPFSDDYLVTNSNISYTYGSLQTHYVPIITTEQKGAIAVVTVKGEEKPRRINVPLDAYLFDQISKRAVKDDRNEAQLIFRAIKQYLARSGD
jgi:hypothetical protein